MMLDTFVSACQQVSCYVKLALHRPLQVLLLHGSQGLTPKAAQDKATELGFVSLEEKIRVSMTQAWFRRCCSSPSLVRCYLRLACKPAHKQKPTAAAPV